MAETKRGLVVILAAIVALGPLSIDLYLPAMPAMVEAFGSSRAMVQWTLSAYLAGFSFFHLFCGPLSDRFGRKPVLLAGLGLYVVMSAACAMATSVEQLVVFRFVQAMGGCCAPTLGRAIVRDSYKASEAARALAYVASLMALAPVVAPSFGALLLQWFDWTATFWSLAVVGLMAIAVTIFLVPESLPKVQPLNLVNIFRNYRSLLVHKGYMGYVLSASFLYGTAFAFLSGSSFVLIEQRGVPTHMFGAWFLFIVIGYIGGNLVTAKLSGRVDSNLIQLTAMLISLSASLVMVASCLAGWNQPLWIAAPMLFITMAIGLVLPQAMALALKPFAHMAATASALMGFMQMGVASIAEWAVGRWMGDDALPMAITILLCSVLSLLVFGLLLVTGNGGLASSKEFD